MSIIANINKKNIKPSKRQQKTGFLGKACIVPKPIVKLADDSVSVGASQQNSSIIFSRDDPAYLEGYGPRGHDKCSTISLTAGHVSAVAKSTDEEENPYYCYSNFEHDAAKIYISEKTDIDKNFNIRPAPNWSLSSVGRSAIGLKADNIRILGNEGVRIVTGVYKHASQGSGVAPTATPAGIELIAMNISKKPLDLQPFVTGFNIQALLKKTLKSIEALGGILEQFVKYQTNMNNVFQEHDHIYGIGDKPAQTCTPCLGLPDPFVKICKEQNLYKDNIVAQLGDLWEFVNYLDTTYLEDSGNDFICSLYNGTN